LFTLTAQKICKARQGLHQNHAASISLRFLRFCLTNFSRIRSHIRMLLYFFAIFNSEKKIMNLNLKATEQNTYDAIVVGSGISGGLTYMAMTARGCAYAVDELKKTKPLILNLKMKICLTLLVWLTCTILSFAQSKIYYNQDCEITMKELAGFYTIAKIDTAKRIFVGKVGDYRMDSVLLGEMEYDQQGKKNGIVKRFESSGEIKVQGIYKNNKAKDWTSGDTKLPDFVAKKRLNFQVDSLEHCISVKESFAVSKFVRKKDYPAIRTLLKKEFVPIAIMVRGVKVVNGAPTFPDGTKALNQFISAFLTYPAEAKRNNIKGQVIVELSVNTDGSTADYKVAKGLGFGCDEEALKVVKLLPDFNPAYREDKVVKGKFRVQVTF